MSEHKSGAVSREYHIAVIEKKDRELSALKAQHDELLAAAKAMSESVALLPAADGRILGLLPILCNLRAAIASAEKPPCA